MLSRALSPGTQSFFDNAAVHEFVIISLCFALQQASLASRNNHQKIIIKEINIKVINREKKSRTRESPA